MLGPSEPRDPEVLPGSQMQASALPRYVLEGELNVHLCPALFFQKRLSLSVQMPPMTSTVSCPYLELNLSRRIFSQQDRGKVLGF